MSVTFFTCMKQLLFQMPFDMMVCLSIAFSLVTTITEALLMACS